MHSQYQYIFISQVESVFKVAFTLGHEIGYSVLLAKTGSTVFAWILRFPWLNEKISSLFGIVVFSAEFDYIYICLLDLLLALLVFVVF